MKTALFVYGGWEGHNPKRCAQIAAGRLEEKDYKVELSDSLEVLANKEKLMSLDLIVSVWTGGELSKEQQASLAEAVRNGVGLAGWHGAADAFGNSEIYKLMVGGRFVWHPAEDVRIDVKITKPNDEIMRGIDDFTVTSEQYYMHVDPSNEVLATAKFNCDELSDVEMPVAWKRKFGKGRVFYFSIGHDAKDLAVPQVREIIGRGMLWAGK